MKQTAAPVSKPKAPNIRTLHTREDGYSPGINAILAELDALRSEVIELRAAVQNRQEPSADRAFVEGVAEEEEPAPPKGQALRDFMLRHLRSLPAGTLVATPEFQELAGVSRSAVFTAGNLLRDQGAVEVLTVLHAGKNTRAYRLTRKA